MRMSGRQIRLAIVQVTAEFPASAGETKQSRVPGKASKVNIIVTVLKSDTGGRGE